MLNDEQKKQALQWYISGIDLVTIAQHFGITRDELSSSINNVNHKGDNMLIKLGSKQHRYLKALLQLNSKMTVKQAIHRLNVMNQYIAQYELMKK